MSYWNALSVSGSPPLQRLQPALRHREGVVGEIDLLLVLVPLEHREIDDPGQFEPFGVDRASDPRRLLCARRRRIWRIFPDRQRRRTRVAFLQAQLGANGLDALRPDVLGDRPAPAAAFASAFASPARRTDIAQPRLAFALRPASSCGRKRCAEPPPGAGIAQTSFFGVSSMRAKTLKPEPRKCSDTSCMTSGLRRSGLSEPYLRMASA